MTAAPPELRRRPRLLTRVVCAPLLGAMEAMARIEERQAGRPAKRQQHIRNWDELARDLLYSDPYSKKPIPRLISSTITPEVTEVLCEPPARWVEDAYQTLSASLCNHYSGSDVLWEPVSEQGARRRLRIQVVKAELPTVTRTMTAAG